MRTQATDQAFEHDLENSGCDEGIQQAEDGIVDVSERANSDLHHQDEEDRNERG
jgi:hypothetical protein